MSTEKSKRALLEKAFRLGFEYERNYGGCSQSVLAAIQDVFSLEDGGAFKAATGLAGGISKIGMVCGAFTGGVLALSLWKGRERSPDGSFEDPGYEIRDQLYGICRKLYDKFEREYDSCICRDIQKKIFGRSFNLQDVKQYEEFEREGAHVDKCPQVVGRAAQWIAELICQTC